MDAGSEGENSITGWTKSSERNKDGHRARGRRTDKERGRRRDIERREQDNAKAVLPAGRGEANRVFKSRAACCCIVRAELRTPYNRCRYQRNAIDKVDTRDTIVKEIIGNR